MASRSDRRSQDVRIGIFVPSLTIGGAQRVALNLAHGLVNQGFNVDLASVFVLSSVIEAFGNVLVEAMAVGTPVVSTNCASGPTEILDAGKYGRLVAIADPNQLAEGILATLRHPPNLEELKQRAKAFSIEQIVKQYIQVLKVSAQHESPKQLVDYKKII